jgi:hypothetical protein
VKQATLLVAILLALAAPALAKNVTLGWDPAQNADIAGYRLHYGSGAGLVDPLVKTIIHRV